jgi:hypothetical protein
MKKTILLLAMISLIVACSSPLDKKYSDETMEADAKEIKESGDLDSEDAKLIAGWIMKSKFQGKDLTDKTYREILEEAKDFKTEQEELAKKAKMEAEAKKKKMQEAIVVSLFDKGFAKADYEDYNSFSYVLKNKSEKDIKAFKFSFDIYDALGDELGDGYQVSSTDNTVKAGEEFKTTIYYDYNQFTNDDIKIKNAKFEDLTFDIRVHKIVYTDGTILE